MSKAENTEDVQDRMALLKIGLAAAVPLWITEMRHWTVRKRSGLAAKASKVVAAKGNAILYKGRRRSSVQDFEDLAKGIAAAAYQPEGIEVLGLKFKVEKDE
jgi:hypothetical protein